MSAQLRQKDRIASFFTPLGPDFFALTKFEAEEGLSELFTYRIEAVSTNANADLTTILGEKCRVSFTRRDGSARHFNGILAEAQFVGMKDKLGVYRFTLRPWLWLLSHRSDCRIFKDVQPKDVIEKIFAKEGKAKFTPRLSDSYQTMDYCVQYRETDLAFVLRLMEHHGIYYYFKHSEDGHDLILSDSRSSHDKVSAAVGRGGGKSQGGSYPFLPRGGSDRRHAEHITAWTKQQRLRTGKVQTRDYDYEKSTADLTENQEAGLSKAKQFEKYEYPGRYTERNDGSRFAKVRVQAEQALDGRRLAAGDAVSLHPGALMDLSNHDSDNASFLVVRAAHAYALQSYTSGGRHDEEVYSGNYELQEADKPFRAPIVAPKPIIYGPQTAKVIGENNQGEEGDIDVDDYGRILVRFHWDREDSTTSRRVRVAQVWSGKGWGGSVIPRIGQEAVVEFIEGNPDEPIVTGTLANDQHMPAYSLPGKKTQSWLKSESTDGRGFRDKYNEIKFEDRNNSEEFSFHAQKDLKGVILNTERREIAKNFEGPAPARETRIKQNDDKTYVENGKYYLEASQEIQLVCGQSKITMTPNEIKIESITIKIDSQAKTDVTSSGMIVINAPMVKIN